MQGGYSATKSEAHGHFHRLWAAVPFLIAIMMLSGCTKHGPSNNISSSAFDSASPDVKQLWTDGMNAWKGHHYPEAAKNFVSLRAKADTLSPEQKDEMIKAVDEFGQEALTAANKGDAAATQAVLALREGAGRRGGATQ
jgi:hypothetical protein